MADTEASTRPSSTRDESSDSESSVTSDDGETSTAVEWLATGRSKRSTAGNRMKSMLATEEPDDDLELLFAEDGSDAGFTDVDDGGSDVQMDSSSDSEDENKADDDLEGEHELERKARESRAAQRKKRKAQDAIPAKFRKKVRISDRPSASPRTPDSSSVPAPRPKKKSERTSWLPTTTDMPTRASARQTTVLSKEQLHQQMLEREAKRLKQVAAMEKKAKKAAALKKPPMTQEERLAEAARVEKRNAKSLNRWEEAEKVREEERLAKLAALNNRTLKGPVVTMWSGVGIWDEGDKGGMAVSIEEKPARKKREKKDKGEKGKAKEGKLTDEKAPDVSSGSPATADDQADKPENPSTAVSAPAVLVLLKTEDAAPGPGSPSPSTPQAPSPDPPSAPATAAPKLEDQPRLMAPPSISSPVVTSSPMAMPNATPPPGLKAPILAPPVLAPPMGLQLGASHMTPKSSVLAPPNTAQRPSPLSLPPMTPNQTQPAMADPPATTPSTALQPTQPNVAPAALPVASSDTTTPAAKQPPPTSAPDVPDAQNHTPAPEQENTDPAALPPKSTTKTTRHAIILQNFDKDLIRDKTAQTQVLFGRRPLSKLPKPAPVPMCAITGHPARYRDPRTGLHYFNSYAYRELQRLARGEYRFSALVGAWVGSCTYAAQGVPDRFLTGGPRRPTEEREGAKAVTTDEKSSAKEMEMANKGNNIGPNSSIGSSISSSPSASPSTSPSPGISPSSGINPSPSISSCPSTSPSSCSSTGPSPSNSPSTGSCPSIGSCRTNRSFYSSWPGTSLYTSPGTSRHAFCPDNYYCASPDAGASPPTVQPTPLVADPIPPVLPDGDKMEGIVTTATTEIEPNQATSALTQADQLPAPVSTNT